MKILNVSSTFTAEPIKAILLAWIDAFGLELKVEFSPFNQVFQEIIRTQNSTTPDNPLHLILLRFEDWVRNDQSPEQHQIQQVMRNYDQLIACLQSREPSAPCIIGLFPVNPNSGLSATVQSFLKKLYHRYASAIESMDQVFSVDFRQIEQRYQTGPIFDTMADNQGHLPFSEGFYAAMGTMVARKIRACLQSPFKVLALDCDNTLWEGVVGEDGPDGIKVAPGHKALQEFALRKRSEGFLLVLASKNNESDVWDVFEKNEEMVLKKEHFVDWEINWKPKSGNLLAMAQRLNLSGDSICFLDDSPAECAEVIENAPQVLALNFPKDEKHFDDFLENIWALDKLVVTQEDQKRSEMYLEEKSRKALLEQDVSLERFLASLELKVSMHALQIEQVARAAQLTQRTNQFNFSTIRRSEKEILDLIDSNDYKCWMIAVKDKFGSYGNTGLIIAHEKPNELIVDSFMMSCRVLGRGVEDAIIYGLKRHSEKKGLSTISILFQSTKKNQPALQFMERVKWNKSLLKSGKYIFTAKLEDIPAPAEFVSFFLNKSFPKSKNSTQKKPQKIEVALPEKPEIALNGAGSWDYEIPENIPSAYLPFLLGIKHHTSHTLNSFLTDYSKKTVRKTGGTLPQDEIENKIANIWADDLFHVQVFREDKFLDLGGDSIKAVQIVSKIQRKMGFDIGFEALLDNPSVATLAKKLGHPTKLRSATIPKLALADHYEVSHQQIRLLVLDQMDRGGLAYNEAESITWPGNLEPEPLKRALQAVVNRHASLRTHFATENDLPRQKVLDQIPLPLTFLDLQADEKPAETIANWEIQSLNRQFDLYQGPLFRIIIFKVRATQFKIVLVMHHSICDASSFNIFWRDLLIFYKIETRQNQEYPSPLSFQYTDFATWQNKQLNSPRLDSHKEWWLKRLSGDLPLLDLPTDFTRPRQMDYVGETLVFTIPNSSLTALRDLGKKEKSTLFMVLVALVKTLLYRYSGQNEIISGSPVAGRDLAELNDQIGFYANTLVLRDKLDGNHGFLQFLRNVRTGCLEALSHQEYPFDKLVDQLDLPRELSRSPVFDLLIALQNILRNDFEINGVSVDNRPVIPEASKFDLSFYFTEKEKELQVKIEYYSGIFSRERIQRMQAHFLELMENVIRFPTAPIDELSILPKPEFEEITQGFNGNRKEIGLSSIIDLFQKEIAKNPSKTALIFKGRRTSFGSMGERVARLSHHLQKNKLVLPKDRVGVMMDRSDELLIVLFSILNAGAAYVPLHPDLPLKKLSAIASNAGLKTVIINQNQIELAGELIAISDDINACFNYETEKAHWDQPENSRPLTENQDSPESTAYIIYTSGSTGEPNGVEVLHRNVTALAQNLGPIFGMQDSDIVLANTRYNFDMSVLELLCVLAKGMTLVISPKEVTRSASRLLELINREQVTVLEFTPSHLKLYFEEWKYQLPHSTRILLVGGEPLTPDLYQTLKSHPEVNIFNVYGPTETTVWSTFSPIFESTKISVGRPLPNEELYVLSETLQPLPIGIPGEVCIGGGGVSKGYWKRTDLNQYKFPESPFKPGENLFRTGDLGQWETDGTLTLLGRKDLQVKVRGHRIELGEIDRTIKNFPGIKDVVVTTQNGASDEAELVTFFTADREISVPDLKNKMGKILPSYMIPAKIYKIDAIPLTSRGKIDHKKLKEWKGPSLKTTEYEPPNGKIASMLVEICQEILGLQQVGIKDDFFEIGGHSLKATQLVARIHKRLGVKLKLSQVFENSRLDRMSNVIEAKAGIAFQAIPKVRKAESHPLSRAQERILVLSLLDESKAAYNVARAYILDGPLEMEALQQALDRLVARHESLRTVFILNEDTPKQKVLPGRKTSINKGDLTRKNHHEIKQFLNKIARQPFDLEHGPLLKIGLFKIADNQHILLLNLHHIISDGWSLRLLKQELETNYQSIKLGKQIQSQGHRIQYKDYAAWQHHILQTSTIRKQEKYWMDKISPSTTPISLPADRDRPKVKSYLGEELRFQFDDLLWQKLEKMSLKYEATAFMALVAMVKTLVYNYTSQTDIAVGSPVAGRTHPDLEGQIGFFVNTLVLRDKINEKASFAELLQQVKRTTIEALDNQDYPFDQLISKLDIPRDTTRAPLFDILVALQTEEKYATINSHWQPFHFDIGSSLFDLSFYFEKSKNGLQCILEYNTDIFDRSRMELLQSHLLEIAHQVIEEPEIPLCQIQLAGQVSPLEMLQQFNQSAHPFPEANLVKMFKDQVAKTPNKTALIFEEKHISYRELNVQSNQVAHYLLGQKEWEPEARIGLLTDRGIWMVIGMWGILKAGGAYVPLEPAYPQNRLISMIEDAGLKTLLVNSDRKTLATDIKAATNCVLETLDLEENGTFSDQPTTDPEIQILPSQLAYVIYTSGSTGKPKGVMLEHRGIADRIRWMLEFHQLNETDSVVQKTPFIFDISVWEFFTPLCSGAALVLCKKEVIYDPHMLARLIGKEKIKNLHFVPGMYSVFLETLSETELPLLQSVKNVFSCGEALLPQTVRRHHQRIPFAQLHNMYGPTEASLGVTYYPTQGDENPVPIGKPLWNARLYILDGQLKPVAMRAEGEIYIAGTGLARGYLNRPELTAELFLEDPFFPNQKMYRSGDLGRWREDGNLDFLGRVDQQIKIRGFRVELGEIESVLSQHPKINGAVVMVEPTPSGDNTLRAFLTTNLHIQNEELRSYLRESLPDHMVPAFYSLLENFPLNPSGKIDRKALSLSKAIIKSQVPDLSLPKNDLEQAIHGIWSELLNNPTLGTQQNFFHLGGNSLILVRMMEMIRKKLGFDLRMSQLFRNPTIAGMANLISSGNLKDPIEWIDLEKESAISLEKDENQVSRSIAFPPKNILLTGSTGFVGAFLLAELIQNTKATIWCLVRDQQGIKAIDRLDHNLEKYGLSLPKNRIQVIAGDLGLPNLGLEDQVWSDLAENLDAILHNGAFVNFTSNFAHSKPSNVDGTRTLMKLAASGQPKAFHFISTTGIFTNNGPIVAKENTSLHTLKHLASKGYQSSKWVAEQMVKNASSTLSTTYIYRLGTITASSQTGIRNQDDFFHRLITGCIKMGYYPENSESWKVDVTPVDQTAKIISEFVASPPEQGTLLHLSNPNVVPFPEFLEREAEKTNLNLKKLPFVEWLKRVREACLIDQDSPLFLILPIITEPGFRFGYEFKLNSEKSLKILAERNFQWVDSRK